MTERDIFIAALQKDDSAQRQAYLDEACAQQPELRQQVEHLLRLHETAGSFLGKPAAEAAATGAIEDAAEQASSPEIPGAVIGPYKLLQQIGEGGMGVVFMAEQTQPVQRKVALKVIKPGMDSRQVIARFEAERQALAMMDHVNIARVLDAGMTGGEPGGASPGRPYFVMELVHGVPITKYCDDNQLTPRERLELFVLVCQAIQHAHQKGIIHRDIKPSNILVTQYDGKPVPKVIDFGVAKAAGQSLTDKTLVTGFGNIVGTLEYMSPEQAEINQLDIDTRCDIYSLGVLLYELLAGSPPFTRKELEKAGMLEMLRVIREQEPSKPSTKLSTAEGLPTLAANRGTEPAKLTKLVRGELDWIVMKALDKDRNRRYETANGFAMDVQRYLADELVEACPPSAWYRLRKFARRNRGPLTMASVATAALVLVVMVLAGSIGWVLRDRDAQRAITAEQANLALNEAAVLQVQQKWREALAAVKRAEAVLANGGDAELHNRARELRKDLAMVAELDELRIQKSFGSDASFKGGDSRASLGYTRAFNGYGIRVLADPPMEVAASIQSRGIREQLLAALDDWILVQSDAGVRERLRAIAELADADELRNRMRKAFVENNRRALEELAAGPEVANLPPATGYLLGQALANAGAGPRAVQVLAAVQQRHPQEFWLNFQLGIQLLWGPGVQHSPQAAAGYLRAALASRPDYATVYMYLGLGLPGPEHLDEVIALNRKAIELSPTYYDAHVNLGLALSAQGKHAEAVAACRNALRLQPEDPKAYNRLAHTLAAQGNHAEATAEFRKALRLRPEDPEAHYSLGNSLSVQGKHAEAVAVYREALRLRPDYSEAHNNLGIALFEQKEYSEADNEFRKALRLRPEDPESHNNLASSLATQGKHAEAEAECREAVRLRPDFPEAHNNLGGVLGNQGKHGESEAEFREALRLRPDYPGAHTNLGIALGKQGKHVEAEAELREVLRLRPDYAGNHTSLGITLSKQGKHAAAAAEYASAFAAAPKLADGLRTQHRYNAACAAALAGCGQGEDASKLDEKERPQLRRQALAWLRADLAAWEQLLEKEPDKTRATVQQTLRHWQQDADFAGVRGDALAKLPVTERQTWQQLWAEVEQTLRKADDKDTKKDF